MVQLLAPYIDYESHSAQRHRQTTDRRHAYANSRSYCVAVRSAKNEYRLTSIHLVQTLLGIRLGLHRSSLNSILKFKLCILRPLYRSQSNLIISLFIRKNQSSHTYYQANSSSDRKHCCVPCGLVTVHGLAPYGRPQRVSFIYPAAIKHYKIIFNSFSCGVQASFVG